MTTQVFFGVVLLLAAIFVVTIFIFAINSIWDLIVETLDDIRMRKNK